ncbi:hypothetical protein EVAR_44835_1 [Eumeta japonica]|uniref:Uncharacterized protein n=1 Tax=Eumeta variegata TaxID=151549 RepID=A0A4C1YLV2_EUMVA|nr:hypothetical protein EVAR_44835_1 [Eumeta japonica]
MNPRRAVSDAGVIAIRAGAGAGADSRPPDDLTGGSQGFQISLNYARAARRRSWLWEKRRKQEFSEPSFGELIVYVTRHFSK